MLSKSRASEFGDELYRAMRDCAGKASEVTIVMDGRGSQFGLAADGENVLDAGLNHGLDLPFSCKAKLVEDEVAMDITHGLEPGEIEQGFILTCQAHPVSDWILVVFDQK
jgi:ring-1,2-phenylacetyl-CoA epoxidase subunit PaaE